VVDPLDEHRRLALAILERRVVALALLDRAAERRAPERGGAVEVVTLAVDPERGEAALVHDASMHRAARVVPGWRA